MYETNYQVGISRKDKALRTFFSQPKFLWLGIIGLVSALIGTVSLPLSFSTYDYSSFEGFDTSFLESIQALSFPISFSLGLVLSIPAILTAVAFLLFHINAKNPDKNFKVPSTILNVLAILSFVFICIYAVIAVLVIVLAFIGISFANTTDEYIPAFVGPLFAVVAVFLLIAMAFGIFLAYINVRFTKSLKISTTTDEIVTKGVKSYSVIIIFSLISMGLSAISSVSSIGSASLMGVSPVISIYSIIVSVVGFVYYLLMYQFVSGFGKILEAEQLQRTFESAPYNQPAYSETPVTGYANDNQRPFYNNPYTTPESQQKFCRYCGKALNSDDAFCTQCGSKIEE